MPKIFFKGLPGNREEAILAGITPSVFFIQSEKGNRADKSNMRISTLKAIIS